MLSELLIASIMQVGPFWQKGPDTFHAVRPFWSEQAETTDVLWPVFTKHRDWWRFCWFVHDQWDLKSDAYLFEIMPLYWQGKTRPTSVDPDGESYWGFFPFWGTHPHFLLVENLEFCLWPCWMRYQVYRPDRKRCLTTNSVLWPFIHWRDDGSWGFWPFYVCNHQRESFHQTALWPIVTWAEYERDRDTAGEGYSWMVWPLWAEVRRERERQTMFLPPLFSYAETPHGYRWRMPWPLVEIEHNTDRDRITIFPFYEKNTIKGYADGEIRGSVTRFGYKLVELYPDETRVFPFWVSREDDSYFRLWPFYERMNLDREGVVKWSGSLALFPIRWVDSVDRNWAGFWTLYESVDTPCYTDHSLFWGIIRWRTVKD